MNNYYFKCSDNKRVNVFDGGLFIFPVSESFDWEYWNGDAWRNPTYDYNVKCHSCKSGFNLIHKEGVKCSNDYMKYFCDKSCRMRWYRKRNEATSEGALHVWGKTLWDIRHCVWLWEG